GRRQGSSRLAIAIPRRGRHHRRPRHPLCLHPAQLQQEDPNSHAARVRVGAVQLYRGPGPGGRLGRGHGPQGLHDGRHGPQDVDADGDPLLGLHRRRRGQLLPFRRRRPRLLAHHDLRPHGAALHPLRLHHAPQRLPLGPQAGAVPAHRGAAVRDPRGQRRGRLDHQRRGALRGHDAAAGVLLRRRRRAAVVDHGQPVAAVGEAGVGHRARQRRVQHAQHLGQLPVLRRAEVPHGLHRQHRGHGARHRLRDGHEDLAAEGQRQAGPRRGHGQAWADAGAGCRGVQVSRLNVVFCVFWAGSDSTILTGVVVVFVVIYHVNKYRAITNDETPASIIITCVL
ncbi:hypothetical protein CTA2_10129, partial [Colletotrichum tanaceti]